MHALMTQNLYRTFAGVFGRTELLLTAGEFDQSVDEKVVTVDEVLGHLCGRLDAPLQSVDSRHVVERHRAFRFRQHAAVQSITMLYRYSE